MIETILAITQLFMVIQYTTPNTTETEIVAVCNTWKIRITDLDWSTYKSYKKTYRIKDKRWEVNKCHYLK